MVGSKAKASMRPASLPSVLLALLLVGRPVRANDCTSLVQRVLPDWSINGANVDPAQCCDALKTYITCSGDSIVGLTLKYNIAAGPIPQSLSLLQNLQALDLSQSYNINGNISVLATLPNLSSLNMSGDTGIKGAIPVFGQNLKTCDFGNTGLCVNNQGDLPACQATSLPTCPPPPPEASHAVVPSSTPNSGLIEGRYGPSSSTSLFIGIGVGATVLVLAGLLCVGCQLQGRRSVSTYGITGPTKRRHAADGEYRSPPQPRSQRARPSDSEMALITLSRNGPPPRSFSLPEIRAKQSKEEAELDVRARDPFIAANEPPGSEEFSVRRPYTKRRSDEMPLAEGDIVVITRVFRDGWAEGVSRRTGGPAVFPVACLGGGVPIVLAQRISGLMMSNPPAQVQNGSSDRVPPVGKMPKPTSGSPVHPGGSAAAAVAAAGNAFGDLDSTSTKRPDSVLPFSLRSESPPLPPTPPQK